MLKAYRATTVREWSALALLAIFLNGCGTARPNVAPSIEFSRLPRSAEGGTESQAVIEGRVEGARPGEQIVLFAKSGAGVWWVQPFADHPFTAIGSDLQWRNSTHLGMAYAALLVEPGYRPPETIDHLPQKGGPVVAVATAKGEPSQRPASRTLHFSGYEWEIRGVPSNRGGAINTYDPANAWTDTNGLLHLRIARGLGEWTCAEVTLTRSLGYGSYVFDVRDVSRLEPAAVLALFTWDDPWLTPIIAKWTWRSAAGATRRTRTRSMWCSPTTSRRTWSDFPRRPDASLIGFRWEPGRAFFQTMRPAGRRARRSDLSNIHLHREFPCLAAKRST